MVESDLFLRYPIRKYYATPPSQNVHMQLPPSNVEI